MGLSWIHVAKYFLNIRLEVLGSVWCCVHSGLLDNGLEIIARVWGEFCWQVVKDEGFCGTKSNANLSSVR